jgi:hypothetical protein
MNHDYFTNPFRIFGHNLIIFPPNLRFEGVTIELVMNTTAAAAAAAIKLITDSIEAGLWDGDRGHI